MLVRCTGPGHATVGEPVGGAGWGDAATGGSLAHAPSAGHGGQGQAGVDGLSGGVSGDGGSGVGGSEDNSAGAGGQSVAAGGSAVARCDGRKNLTTIDTPTLLASGFAAGTLAPYAVCTTESPNYVRAEPLDGEPAAKVYWQQAGYDGTRMKRGAEACSALAFYKEGWYGFEFYLPSPGFPADKTLGIAQIFALGGCSSWAAMLQVHGDELWVEHRGNCASPAEFQVRLASAIPRNTWLPVVLHFVASHASAGMLEIWYGDAVCTPASPTYRKTGINFGFGAWSGDELSQGANNQLALKFGMYNFDDANYTTGEDRTVYYDNVSQLIGNPANAFATVTPAQ